MKTFRNIVIGLLAVSFVVGGLFVLPNIGTQIPTSTQTASLSNVISSGDWFKGDAAAKVVLVEYGDFQCPACALYHPIVDRLMNEFGDKAQFVYRHFPLREIHANADLASRAAEAAGRQGKFWEMYDKLYQNQTKWAVLTLNAKKNMIDYARSIGLDIAQFEKDIDSDAVKDKVESDYQSGLASGVGGTPTFFLNEKKIQAPGSYDEFVNLIQQALEEGS